MDRTLMLWVVGALALVSNVGVWAEEPSSSPAKSTGAKKLLIFGDPNPGNPEWQKALMEKSLRQVADAFKAHAYQVDLIPTAQLTPEVIKKRLAEYARTLTADDTFVMYSHSHGTDRGTYFASWNGLAEAILAIPARNVVVFTMSCHSGNLTDTLLKMKSRWEGRSSTGRSLVVLTSGAADQNTGPSPDRAIGNPFTYAVATALQGAADEMSANRNGQIEMKELVDYVRRTAREKSRRQSLDPQFAGEFPLNAVFVSN